MSCTKAATIHTLRRKRLKLESTFFGDQPE